jgi:hypothetical protein
MEHPNRWGGEGRGDIFYAFDRHPRVVMGTYEPVGEIVTGSF